MQQLLSKVKTETEVQRQLKAETTARLIAANKARAATLLTSALRQFNAAKPEVTQSGSRIYT